MLEYSDNRVDYSMMDPVPVQTEADAYLDMALVTDDEKTKQHLLEIAAGKYFLLSKINPQAVTPYVQLARIYDITRKDRYAKEYFYRATNIENLSPFANFYFGEYYFRRDDFRRALRYYLIAYENGYDNITMVAGGFQDGVDKAFELPDEVILLSPACSSYDMFSGYEERGRVFKEYALSKK